MGCVIPHQSNAVNIPHQTNAGLKAGVLHGLLNDATNSSYYIIEW